MKPWGLGELTGGLSCTAQRLLRVEFVYLVQLYHRHVDKAYQGFLQVVATYIGPYYFVLGACIGTLG